MYRGLAIKGRNLDHTCKTCRHLLGKDIDFILLQWRAEEIAKKNTSDHFKKNSLNKCPQVMSCLYDGKFSIT